MAKILTDVDLFVVCIVQLQRSLVQAIGFDSIAVIVLFVL